MRNAGLDEAQAEIKTARIKTAGNWVTETVFGPRIKYSPSGTTNPVALFTIHWL